MIGRSLTLFGGLFVLILAIGWVLGAPFTTARLIEAFALSLVALGLNIQWGYGGLFNFGIMGFLMLGGAAVTFVSYPVNPAFWGSDGPWMLGRALIAFAAAALLVIGAQNSHRVGITGRWKATLVVLAWFIGYILYRSQLDPAAAYIESSGGGFIGGLGGHPVLGWLFGGVLAAGVAYVIGKICLGLRTDYLAIATIGISEIIRALIKNMDWLTRGTLTVSPIPWPTPLPQELAPTMGAANALMAARGGFLLLVLVVLGIAMWLISRAYSGPWGRMMRAIRDNHVAAASMGKNVTARQLEIFVFGSVLMGIGGAILVTFVQIFDPSSYQPINHTFIIWVMIIVGGAGNNWGAIFGAVLIWLVWVISEPLARFVFDWVSLWSTSLGWGAIPEIDSRAAQMRVFVLGLVITIALRFAPKGLIPEVVRRDA